MEEVERLNAELQVVKIICTSLLSCMPDPVRERVQQVSKDTVDLVAADLPREQGDQMRTVLRALVFPPPPRPGQR